MGTLRDCIKKAGLTIKPADGDALLKRAKEYVEDGLKVEAAWEAAVKEAIDDSLQPIPSTSRPARGPQKRRSKNRARRNRRPIRRGVNARRRWWTTTSAARASRGTG